MDTFVCPKQHASTEPDYCSECGAKLAGAEAAAQSFQPPAPVAAAPAGGATCPACGAARDDRGIAFCEVCGCDFAAPPPVTSPGEMLAPPQASPTVSGWLATLSVDRSLRSPGSPDPPADIASSTISLKQPVSLIGRKSEARAIFPEIAIAYDDAVSHRHAILQLFGSGVLLLRDIGAANGTHLNGKLIDPMVDYPLKDADEITLGHWSRISIKAVY
jgi:hypothetical protein